MQEGSLQEWLWHGVHSQLWLMLAWWGVGAKGTSAHCIESSHSLGLDFCVTPEAQWVPVMLARKRCGGCQLTCKICFLNLFDNKTTPQKIIILNNHGKKHMDFPSASCLFWTIGYNLSSFRELQCRPPRAASLKSPPAFTPRSTGTTKDWPRLQWVTALEISWPQCLWQKQRAWLMWTTQGDYVGSHHRPP